jgi:hypothetical protein
MGRTTGRLYSGDGSTDGTAEGARVLERRTRRHLPPADIELAYRHWRESGSLRRTAHALGIAEGTVIAWCRMHSWVQRRRVEDATDDEIVREHATDRLIEETDALLDRLLSLSEEAKSDAVKLRATKHALALLGIVPAHPAGRSGPVLFPSPDTPPAWDEWLADPDADRFD